MRLILVLLSLPIHLMAQNIQYKEPHRPQIHFSPKANWMNDPNGMVYYAGEYHLFYQYYPDSTVWGPMHWGHAVSKDMVHWQHLPIALYPDSLGYIFSGSVVVDEHNTSGLQKGTEKVLVALFTYHDMAGEKSGSNRFQTQGLAYSHDRGRTWHKYAGNPVLANPGFKDFRDPKISWHQASAHWIMTLAVGNEIQFYRSKNLLQWTFTGKFGAQEGSHGGVWECPDLFEMTVKGTTQKKWVLLVSIGNGAVNGGSGTQYFIGNFDGKNFINDAPKESVYWLDEGTDNYAGVTWSNAPNNRRLFLGWMSNWQYAQQVPTAPWRSAMTIPRELTLEPTMLGPRLYTRAVKELHILRGTSVPIHNDVVPSTQPTEWHLEYDVSSTTAAVFGIQLQNDFGEQLSIGYDQHNQRFYIDRSEGTGKHFSTQFPAIHFAPRKSKQSLLKMHIFLDASSVELFADDGATVMTDLYFPGTPFTRIKLYETGGKASLIKGSWYPLASIWK